MSVIPPYLSKGDTIGIVCPSGFMAVEKIKACITTLNQWGFQVISGNTVGSQFNYFSGTDEQRLEDLQRMLDNDLIKAILCGRGGYGLTRIIDQLSFKKFKKNPKWIIGYSDITVLHSHIFRRYKTASLHSPMAAAFNDGESTNQYVQSLREAITGKRMKYSCFPHIFNKTGVTKGEFIGGNLALLAHLAGTNSAFKPKGKILFLEDVGEYIYNVDRMMYQLKRSGTLSKLSGLIIGNFTEMKDTEVPFGKDVYDVICDAVKEYDYPVCYQFPVGHCRENYALKIGVRHKLHVQEQEVTLYEVR
jgi:muramoyltetrapeptide carboxypeptidase